MSFPEYKRINKEFEVAYLVDDLRTETIKKAIQSMLKMRENSHLKMSLKEAKEKYCWDREKLKLIDFYQEVVSGE